MPGTLPPACAESQTYHGHGVDSHPPVAMNLLCLRPVPLFFLLPNLFLPPQQPRTGGSRSCSDGDNVAVAVAATTAGSIPWIQQPAASQPAASDAARQLLRSQQCSHEPARRPNPAPATRNELNTSGTLRVDAMSSTMVNESLVSHFHTACPLSCASVWVPRRVPSRSPGEQSVFAAPSQASPLRHRCFRCQGRGFSRRCLRRLCVRGLARRLCGASWRAPPRCRSGVPDACVASSPLGSTPR